MKGLEFRQRAGQSWRSHPHHKRRNALLLDLSLGL
ncbi:Uncharacterised protein [Vibrio cholerae]|nr:Uncharacterised protein [Vibrio cholerae]